MSQASRLLGVHSVLVTIVLAAVVMFSGCGGGSSKETKVPPPPPPAKEAGKVRLASHQQPATLYPVPKFDIPAFRQWGVERTAADSLARIGAAAVPALIDALRDPNPAVRSQAAWALARIGPDAKAAVGALAAAMSDEDPKVRKNAARALGQIGPAAAEAIPVLARAMVDGEPPRGAARR